MKKMYLDVTETDGCIGVLVKDVEIVFAGTTVYSMSARHKNEEYQRYADEYDIHFIFDDNMPEIDFYTIPQVDILATDSKGCYIGTIGNTSDLQSDAPICYIDKNTWKSYLIAESGEEFLKKASTWKESLEPYDGVTFYHSKEDAMKENEFINIDEFKEEE